MSFRFSRDKWMLIFAMVCGLAMIFLDATVLPVALPTLQKEFGMSDIHLQWIVNVYFLGEAGFVILGGKLADIYGSRKIYLCGLLLFAAASALGGFAINDAFLLIARSLQGVGAALLAPSTTAIIITRFPKEQRGKAIGISVAIGALFLSLGPFFGGFVTEFLSWRWIFFVNIFITAVGVLLTLKFVPNYPGKKSTIDYVSLFLFVGGLLSLTIGMMEGGRFGFTEPFILGLFFVGVTFFFVFYLYYRSHKTKEPFFDFALFRRMNFFVGNLHAFIVQFVMMNGVFWAIFFQDGLWLSPAQAGFWTFLSTSPVLLSAPLAGYMSDKFGMKFCSTIGFTMLIITFSLILCYSYMEIFPLLIFALVLYGSSISQILTPLGPFILGSAPVHKRGLASGIFNTLRFSGATFGMAILGSIYNGIEKKQMTALVETYPETLNSIQKKELELIYSGVQKTSETGLDVQFIRKDAAVASFHALRAISGISLAVLIVGFIFIFVERNKKHVTEISR